MRTPFFITLMLVIVAGVIYFTKLYHQSISYSLPKSKIDPPKEAPIQILSTEISLASYLKPLPIGKTKLLNNKSEEKPISVREFEEEKTSGETTESFQKFLSDQAPSQYFAVSSNSFITITGSEGTKLSFPSSMFLLDDTTIYSGDVIIQLKEVYDQAKMVFANFTTASDYEPLESAGMIYWNATTPDGTQLQIDSGSSAMVTFASTNYKGDFQIFLGEADKGNLNWNVIPSSNSAPQLAIFPDDYLSWNSFRMHRNIKHTTKSQYRSWNKRIKDLSAGTFNQTQLASREFQYRLQVIRLMGYDVTLLDYYLQNPNDLAAGDSLALLQLAAYSKDIRLSNYSISKNLFAKGYGKKKWLKDHVLAFQRFSVQSNFFSEIVFLSKSDLKKKNGLNDRLFTGYEHWLKKPAWYTTQVHYEYVLRALTDRPLPGSVSSMRSQGSFVSYRIPKMGFINCDRFIDMKQTENVIVKISDGDQYSDLQSYLIFKKINSVMSGYINNGDFVFPNIPHNYTLHLIVMGLKDGKTYFAEEPIDVVSKIEFDVSLAEMPKEDIQYAIKEICGKKLNS